MYACARARVCVFIKLHITAQFGPLILVIHDTRNDPPKGGSVILNTKTSDQTCVLCECLSVCCACVYLLNCT